MIPKIDLNTTRNDPRPQMISKFFHTRPEMIPEELNRRHIVFTDGNLPHRRRYLALKICYYNNSDASYQLLKLVLSGDTGVSLNPGPAEYNYNDDGEQSTQSSQSPIHACNDNSFL